MTRRGVLSAPTTDADARARRMSAGLPEISPRALAVPLVLIVALVWSYWPVIAELIRDWHSDDNYSVGQLVPFAALYLLWQDRRRFRKVQVQPCWWGALLLVGAEAMHWFGYLRQFQSIERYAMVLAVWALVLWVGGTTVFRKVSWILLFLFLMVPLPGVVHDRISPPLQEMATTAAVFTLELIGVVVRQEGNTMLLNDRVPVAVAEACSGLRMLTAFVVVAAVFAYVFDRPRWQKLVLLLSAVPVAILCNLVRLVLTALLFLWFDSELAERFFHDFAGWTMMPMAILILLGELWLMSRLVIEDDRGVDKVRL